MPAGVLYAAYSRWCDGNRYQALSQTAFGSTLTERGFGKARESSGRVIRRGLALHTR